MMSPESLSRVIDMGPTNAELVISPRMESDQGEVFANHNAAEMSESRVELIRQLGQMSVALRSRSHAPGSVLHVLLLQSEMYLGQIAGELMQHPYDVAPALYALQECGLISSREGEFGLQYSLVTVDAE